jgi:hypothetical protein
MVTLGLANASPAKRKARAISVIKKTREELSNISDHGVYKKRQNEEMMYHWKVSKNAKQLTEIILSSFPEIGSKSLNLYVLDNFALGLVEKARRTWDCTAGGNNFLETAAADGTFFIETINLFIMRERERERESN